jgi:hypothetical protein
LRAEHAAFNACFTFIASTRIYQSYVVRMGNEVRAAQFFHEFNIMTAAFTAAA